ncbi:MAG: VIT1/CCC1 family protein [Thermoproteota archaeon]
MDSLSGINAELKRLVETFCIDELTESVLYSELAKIERDAATRKVLRELSEQEHRHYSFWRSILGRDCRARMYTVFLLKVAYRILGPIFVLNMLEQGEREAVEKYRSFIEKFGVGEDVRREVEDILGEEEEHEEKLIDRIEDIRTKYLGYAALGLSDALVEVTGVHAGFLGATASTTVAGIAGLVVGFSAAISMAGAAYVQSRHSGSEKPGVSAMVTGLSYMLSVVLLALPYFLLGSMAISFATSVVLALAIVAAFTYYSSVIRRENFRSEFVTTSALLLGTAAASYLFGDVMGRVFGIQGAFS